MEVGELGRGKVGEGDIREGSEGEVWEWNEVK